MRRENWALPALWRDTPCSSLVETGMSENFLSCGWALSVPLEWRRVCWGTSCVASRVSRTLSRLKREGGISLQTPQRKGPNLALKGESPGFSRVLAGNLWFLLSYNGDMRDPLVFPQESQASMRVERGLSRFLSSRCRVLGPHLEVKPEAQCSPPVLTWNSGFLWRFSRGVRPHLVWRHASPLSS